jgi:hypothetical protein
MNVNGEPPERGRWEGFVALATVILAGAYAVTNPHCPAGEICQEVLKGAIGGAVVGTALVLARFAGWL